MPISKLRKSFVFPASGASGAVTATILLDIFLHPTARLYFIIPVPAMLLGMFLLGQDFLRVNSGYMFISGSTHLGGATVAAIVWVWATTSEEASLSLNAVQPDYLGVMYQMF